MIAPRVLQTMRPLAGGEPLPIAAPAQALAFAGLACLLMATFRVAPLLAPGVGARFRITNGYTE